MKILMCSPDYYGIYYEINPWMDIHHQADAALAKQQWQALYQTILKTGATVELLEPVSGLPDIVFTANAGLVYQTNVLLAHFRVSERQGEESYFKRWFQQAGFQVLTEEKLYFEGAGDALFWGEALIGGYGLRSEKSVYEHPFFKDVKTVTCELVDPYYYHLDTCFCPLNDQLAIWYPDAFSDEAQVTLKAQGELIAVLPEEAKHFACNAVVVEKHVIIPTGCPQLTHELETRGFQVHECDMSEYLKAGGACKCLTLQI